MPKNENVFANLLAHAAELSQRAAVLAQQGNVGGALELEQQADQLRARARALAPQKADDSARQSGSGRRMPSGKGNETSRNLVISSLSEFGVPASPKAVAEYVEIRFGKRIDHRTLASLRRDEVRAWSSPRASRAAFIVPALEGRRFYPVRGKVALSAWPIERRVIGPWSERADHLTATKNLARTYEWLSDADPETSQGLRRLVADFAATVPGAITQCDELDHEQVIRAVDLELDVIGPRDHEWRAEAALRAAEMLSESQQLWGLRPPSIVSENA